MTTRQTKGDRAAIVTVAAWLRCGFGHLANVMSQRGYPAASYLLSQVADCARTEAPIPEAALSVSICEQYRPRLSSPPMIFLLAILFLLVAASPVAATPIEATGSCDQVAINAAIRALPDSGGVVELAPGNFQICRGSNPLGGIIIDRSNVWLRGAGAATVLRLRDHQDTNVIRAIGENTENIRISDLTCDGNRSANEHREFKFRFEVSCIRAGGTDNWLRNITVEHVQAFDCSSLCVMLFGRVNIVVDSLFGNADSDIVELLGECNQIVNNRAIIDGITGHGFGGDAQSDLLISGNTVIVQRGGVVQEAIFRTYPGLYRTVLTSNIVRVEPGGWVNRVTDLRSFSNVIGENAFGLRRNDAGRLTEMKFNGGTILVGNTIQSAKMILVDTSDDAMGFVLGSNVLIDTELP